MNITAAPEPTATILAAVAKAGFQVPEARLTRWHRAGIISKPVQKSLGRGKGTVSLYPAGTSRQVLAICYLRNKHHRLDDVRWLLWFNGFPIEESYWRGHLRNAALEWDKKINCLNQAYAVMDGEDEAASEALDAALSAAFDKRLPPSFLRKLRKIVGRKNFDTIRQFVLALGTGKFAEEFSRESHDREEDQITLHLIETALGFREHGKHSISPQIGRWLPESIWQPLADLSDLLGADAYIDLAENLPPSDLAQARDEIRDLLCGLQIMEKFTKALFGGKASGFKMLSKIVEASKAHDFAWMLLGWVLIKKSPSTGDCQAVVNASRMLIRQYQAVCHA